MSNSFTINSSNPMNNYSINSSNPTNGYCLVCDCSPYSQDSKIALGIGYTLIILISFVGNILVICTVSTNRRMRTVTNYLIINMAVADLLLTVFNMPSTMSSFVDPRDYYSIEGWLGVALCKFLPFIQSVSVASTVLNMTAIAIDRFFAIVVPLRRYITFPVAYIMMVVVWVVAIGFSAPLLYAQTVVPHPDLPGKTLCAEIWKAPLNEETSPQDYTVVLFVTFYAVPLLVMSVLYSVVIYKLWIRKLPGQRSEQNEQRAERSKKKVLKMLLMVVLLFAICWLPVYVNQFIYFFGNILCGSPRALQYIGYFLSHANSAINPCIYVLFNDNFRKGFKDALLCRCRGRRVAPRSTSIGRDNTYIDGAPRSNPTSPSIRQLNNTYT